MLETIGPSEHVQSQYSVTVVNDSSSGASDIIYVLVCRWSFSCIAGITKALSTLRPAGGI